VITVSATTTTVTIYYTINHFVTTDTDTDTDTDTSIEQPPTGFHWEVDMAGYTEHPPKLNPESYISDIKALTTETEFSAIKEAYMAGEIKRVSPWDTPLTNAV